MRPLAFFYSFLSKLERKNLLLTELEQSVPVD